MKLIFVISLACSCKSGNFNKLTYPDLKLKIKGAWEIQEVCQSENISNNEWMSNMIILEDEFCSFPLSRDNYMDQRNFESSWGFEMSEDSLIHLNFDSSNPYFSGYWVVDSMYFINVQSTTNLTDLFLSKNSKECLHLTRNSVSIKPKLR